MKKPYHPANFKLQPYAAWKIILLAWAANFLGVRFKIEGIPYGAEYHSAFKGENNAKGCAHGVSTARTESPSSSVTASSGL